MAFYAYRHIQMNIHYFKGEGCVRADFRPGNCATILAAGPGIELEPLDRLFALFPSDELTSISLGIWRSGHFYG